MGYQEEASNPIPIDILKLDNIKLKAAATDNLQWHFPRERGPLIIAAGDIFLKKPSNKSDLRARLKRQTDAFVSAGGEIKEILPGQSAYDKHTMPAASPIFQESRRAGTPLNDVLAALEDRRAAAKKKPKADNQSKSQPKPRKRIIYDDFGEPLRVVWIED